MSISIWFQILGLLVLQYLVSHHFLKELGRWLFRVFKKPSMVIHGMAFFLLPGTFIHEAAHLVFAEFMKVRTDGLNVTPEIKENKTIKLGGVKIEETDPVRRMLIGLAPVFLGMIIIWVTSNYIFKLGERPWYVLVIYGYILLQLGLTMFSSSKDLEGGLIGFVLLGLIILFLRFLSEVIIFAPLLRVKLLLLSFLETNIWSLRSGLALCCLIILIFTIILSLFNRVGLTKKIIG